MQLINVKTITVLVAAIGSTVLLNGCKQEEAKAQQQRAPQVAVVEIQSTPQQMVTTLSGRATPYLVAEVRPQVSGILLKRNFTEGALVKEGEVLYQIDPATYQAAVDSAKANLASAKATLTQATLSAKRFAQLVKTQAVSKQANDDAQAALKQAQASVAAAKAQLKSAEINLGYTKIKAPISGKIGRSYVTPGALLTANQTSQLAVIQTLDPIYVDVTQASTELLRLRKEIASGALKAEQGQLKVELEMEDGSKYAESGKLALSEVTVDEGTGSITMRAIFPNPNQELLPGMYVRTKLPEGIRENAILVPQKAVMRTTHGDPYVFVVEDGKAQQKNLETSRTIGTNWLVDSGLKVGDKVIVEGLQRIRPGVPVQIVPAGQQPAAK